MPAYLAFPGCLLTRREGPVSIYQPADKEGRLCH